MYIYKDLQIQLFYNFLYVYQTNSYPAMKNTKVGAKNLRNADSPAISYT